MSSRFFSNNKQFLLILIVFISGIILYLPSIKIPFLNDEIAFIERNSVDNFSELAGLFNKKDYDGDYYRPVGNLASGIVTHFAGYNPVHYRIFNFLLHGANGVLVFLFTILLLKSKATKLLIALFASLFFLAFPLNDYAVIWHTDLFDRIMMMFYFLSLIFYLKKESPSFLSLFFFLLAALSKEMAFSLPVIIFLLSIYLHQDRKISNSVIAILPYLLILFILFLFRWLAFNNNIFNLQDAHSSGTIITVVKNLVIFSGMLIFPFFLRETQEILLNHQSLVYAVGILIFIGSLLLVIKYKRKDILFFILATIVIVSILPASRLLMRWYLYLPSSFFAILLSYILFSGKNVRSTIIALSCLIFGTYYSYTLFSQTKWIAISESGKRIILNFVEKNKDLLKSKEEIMILTIPAKVNDIPLFQLGFDHHLNHFLSEKKKINVSSKSYMSDLDDKIKTIMMKDTISLLHSGDNYFMLSGIEKNVKFRVNDLTGEKLKRIYYIKEKEPDRVIFTYTKGKFYLLKD